MNNLVKEGISNILSTIKGSGSFVTHGKVGYSYPNIFIKNFGPLAFPINQVQARELIAIAHKAPFGKGHETIHDDNVRRAWEIDADQIHFEGNSWPSTLKHILSEVGEQLGLPTSGIEGSLYKMLIYQQGDFFLSHKDSEKEKGMFGTLSINLPSRFTGSTISVSFNGQTKVIDFASEDTIGSFSYAAFYADCDHAIEPLLSGYRVCLVYNLIQSSGRQITPPNIQVPASALAQLLTNAKNDSPEAEKPYYILLGHQYTPENFSNRMLKLDDRPKAAVIMEAANKAGFYAKLCLVTSYQSGTPEYEGGWGDYIDEDTEMEEVYDQEVSIDHWIQDGIPDFSRLSLNEDDLITSFPINDGDPIVKEATGYMGNYGPDLMHWYHYGAVMLWSHEQNARLISALSIKELLDWIDYFNRHPEQLSLAELKAIQQQLGNTSMHMSGKKNESANFTALTKWIIEKKDKCFFKNLPIELVEKYFLKLPIESWSGLTSLLGEKQLEDILNMASSSTQQGVIERYLEVLQYLYQNKIATAIIKNCLAQLPGAMSQHIKAIKQGQDPGFRQMIRISLWFSARLSLSDEWQEQMLDIITSTQQTTYRNDILIPTLLEGKQNDPLYKSILNRTIDFLNSLSEPQPPKDYKRPLPKEALPAKFYQLLVEFFQSPDQLHFDYSFAQKHRDELERALYHADLDIKTETVKRGSPYTLRITKTNKKYKHLHGQWKKDIMHLKALLQLQ